MKRFILSISLLCIFSLYIYPQCIPAYSRGSNVYTCNNVAVETYAPSCEWSAAQKATIKSDLLAEYASAGITSDDILADASTAYNCHAYAWHLTEGQSNYVWINQYTSNGDYNIANYWLGGLNACFDQSSETTSYDKIFYYSGDHSAVKSSVSGKYESKWGNSCLVRHAPTAVPNTYNSSYRRYYVHNPHIYISGPKYFNTSGTFTINNLPSGASVTINCYYPLQTSRSGNVITVTNPYGEAGFASLSATITVGNWTYTTDYIEFLYGNYVPDLAEPYHTTSSYPYQDYGWCSVGVNYLNLVSSSCSRDYFQYIVLQGRLLLNGTVVYTIPFNFSGYNAFHVEFYGGSNPPYSAYNLQLRNITENANSSWVPITDYIPFVQCSESSLYSLSPNPNNGVFTLKQASAENVVQSSALGRATGTPQTKVRIYSFSQSVLLKELPVVFTASGECTINVGDLPKGVYIVQVLSGGNVVESLKMKVQ